MSYIEIEMNEQTLKLEYDRQSIIRMEEMGYNAIHPSDRLYTNFEILVYGGLLKHQPDTTWKDALKVIEYMKDEYGMSDIIENLNDMVNEVFTLKGKKGKKLVRKGTTKAN